MLYCNILSLLLPWSHDLLSKCAFSLSHHSTYHAGVYSGLFDVAGNTSDKCISVLKVGVKVSLLRENIFLLQTRTLCQQSQLQKRITLQWAVPGTWWRTAGVRCMAAGLGGAAPPAGPHWTAHPPGSRGLSWRHRFTHKTARSERHRDRELAAHRRISTSHWLIVSQWNKTVWLAYEKGNVMTLKKFL